jgi:hypothetical protein
MYPTAKDTPNRKQRKAMRKRIFQENKYDAKAARATARRARKAEQEKSK